MTNKAQRDSWISEESVRDYLVRLANEELQLSHREAAGLQMEMERVIFSVESRTKNGKRYFRVADIIDFYQNWIASIRTSNPDYLYQNRGFARQPVSVEEFICSPEYMGQADAVRPGVLRAINKIFQSNQYIEVVLSGSIGWGKNYTIDLSMGYFLYLLSCYHNPQIEFGLAPGSSIVLTFQSITLTLAKKVLFSSFREKIINSPYFKSVFPYDPSFTTELHFPNNISVLPISGSDTSALGMNIIAACIDEINFMARSRKSKLAELRGEDEYDKAKELYLTILRRMKSRFLQSGGTLPGKLFLVSSANYPGDFTSQKEIEAKNNPTVLYISMPQWEAFRYDDGRLDSRRYSGKMFLIDLGDERKQARIINSMDEADDPSNVIEVPIEHKQDFEQDMDAALRDIAGIPRVRRHQFIPSREWITWPITAYRRIVPEPMQLFTDDAIDLDKISSTDLDQLINYEYVDTFIRNWIAHGFTREPEFAIHIDSALTANSVGIAVGRVMGLNPKAELMHYVPATDNYRTMRGIKAPVIFIDGILQVVPPRTEEIDLEKIQGLVLAMAKVGIPIIWLSMDKYESAQLMQNVRKTSTIFTKRISVDRSIDPYMTFKLALRQKRVLYPPHPVLLSELRELELDRENAKVDHPPNGSKDLADSVCGVVYNLTKLRATYASQKELNLQLPEWLSTSAQSDAEQIEQEEQKDTDSNEQDMLLDEEEVMAMQALRRRRQEETHDSSERSSRRSRKNRPKSARPARRRFRARIV